MEIKTHLLICENTNSKSSAPHAMGILSVPWDQVDEHPKLQAVRDALSPEDRVVCEKAGVLNLSVDYGYEFWCEKGVGLVIRDLDVNVDKLSPEKEDKIKVWLEEQYNIPAKAEFTGTELQAALDNPDIKRHITTDMTIAGMGLDAFKEALDAHASGGELPYPLLEEDMEKIKRSLEERGKDANLDAYYKDTAMTMRDEWPSPKINDSEPVEPGQAGLFFFTGFKSSAEAIVKAGPYSALTVYPTEESGVYEYNENGIACAEDGEKVPVSRIKRDDDYAYYPYMAFSTELAGSDAIAAIDRWAGIRENPPLYDGFAHNCVGVAGQVALGDKYESAVKKIAGIEHPEGNVPKITNAMLRQGVLLGATPPEGMSVIGVSVDPSKLPSHDPQGINAALEQIARSPEKSRTERRVIDAVGAAQFGTYAATLDKVRHEHQGDRSR